MKFTYPAHCKFTPRSAQSRVPPAATAARALSSRRRGILDIDGVRQGQGWLTPAFHQRFRNLMLHAAAREGLVCPVYCLMPDHLHLVWMGLRLDWDQINGMAFLRTYLEPELSPAKFQPQPQDEVLRAEQRKRNAFAKVCFYIAANPVRAKLIGEKEIWPFTGCVISGYPKLNPLDEDYWSKFWRIFAKLRQSDADNIKRPPIGLKSNQSLRLLTSSPTKI